MLSNFLHLSTDHIKQLYSNAGDDMAIGCFSGITVIELFSIPSSVWLPILTTLLIPFGKDFGNKIIIPYFRKKFKIDKKNDV
jgi:hypothetical protein